MEKRFLTVLKNYFFSRSGCIRNFGRYGSLLGMSFLNRIPDRMDFADLGLWLREQEFLLLNICFQAPKQWRQVWKVKFLSFEKQGVRRRYL